MVKKKYRNTRLHTFNGGGMSVTSNYSSLGNQYRTQGLFPAGTNNINNWQPKNTTVNSVSSTTSGSGNGNSGGGNFMSNVSQVAGYAGMFDSIAQNITAGRDSYRYNTDTPMVLVEGVLGGQSGTHLANMWNTGAKTDAAVNYINKLGDVDYDYTSSANLLAQHDGNRINNINIDTKGKELEDFIFDPASWLLTKAFGLRESASDRKKRINDAIGMANIRREQSFNDAVDAFEKRKNASILANYRAFGGPVYDFESFGGGPIGYSIVQDKMNNNILRDASKAKMADNAFSKGGSIFKTNYDMGLSFINNGGSHENNPFGGVLMGIAPDGKGNYVEEGEVIFKNYVFSKRLQVPKAIRNKYKLRKPTSFAEAVEEYFKKNGLAERENDPIAQNGFNAFAADMAISQELVRAKKDMSKHIAANGGHLFKEGDFIKYDKAYKDYDTLYGPDSEYMQALAWYNDAVNAAERDQLIADINAGKYNNATDNINGYTVTPDNWYSLATDGKKGPVHNAIIANMKRVLAKKAQGPTAAAQQPLSIQELVNGQAPAESLITLPDGRTFTSQEFERNFGMSAEPFMSRTDASWTPEGIARVAAGSPNVPNDIASALGLTVPPASSSTAKSTTKAPTEGTTGTGNGATDVTSDLSKLGDVYRNMGLYANALGLAYNIFDPYRPVQVDEISPFKPISANPIGDYVPDAHFDINYAANQQAQQAAATKAAIMQSIAPSRNAALLAADFDSQIANGDLRRKAYMDYYDNLIKARTFNRETNKFSSQLGLDVAKSNMSGRQAHDAAKMQQEQFNVSAYDNFKRGRDQAIGQGIEAVANWFNDAARERNNLAMVGALRDSGALDSNESMDMLFNILAGYKPSKTKKSKKNGGNG